MNKTAWIFILSVVMTIIAAVARPSDDNQEALRLAPEISDERPSRLNYDAYPFLKLKHNTIHMNGDDWSDLAEKFRAAAAGDTVFSIVYLGDSHIQADFGGNVLRKRMAEAAGSAGRGIIIPFKLAATNQPNDYSFSMSSNYLASKLMKMPWSTEMTFSGVGLQPLDRRFTLHIEHEDGANALRFHTRGAIPEVKTVRSNGKDIAFESFIDSIGLCHVLPQQTCCSFDIDFDGDKSTVFAGVELLCDSTGTIVHSIGNNGATYSAYCNVDRFGSGLSRLSPDLIIIALGTNEAFGRVNTETLTNNVENLLNNIRLHMPQAKIMIVGPAECYRKSYRYVRRNGRRRRVSSKVVNTKIAEVARTIRLCAEANGIPYYNHYALAGGSGSAAQMSKAKVLGADGIHYTATGYRLWGNLLSDAILDKLMQ